jgi:hypothetical protein
MGTKHEKGEFWRYPSNLASVVTIAGNRPYNLKLLDIAHQNGRRKHENTSFRDASKNMYRLSQSLEIVLGNEKCAL